MQLTDRDKREFQRIQRWRGRRALIFDTETSGLPSRGGIDRQPYVIQLAFIFGQIPVLRGQPFDCKARVSMLIDLPSGKTIDAGASEVHGIDGQTVDLFGVSREPAVQLFASYMGMADVCIGHNVGFDFDRVWDEYRRSSIFGDTVRETHTHMDRECTMQLTRDICAIPPTARMVSVGRNHFKSPKLEESVRAIFGRELEGAHDALVDVDASAELFMHVLDIGSDLQGVAGFHKAVEADIGPGDTAEVPIVGAEELLDA